MASDPVRMVNGTIVVMPSSGTNVIQPGQGMPGVMVQTPGMAQYAGQQFGSPSSHLQQTHRVGPLEKLLKVEMKTLGAIQIILGLIHIGLGGVTLALVSVQLYTAVVTFGGYPFWGGLFFILSGSLSVSAENHLNFNLVNCTVGMNITSAIMALIGIALEIAELVLNSPTRNYPMHSLGAPGIGLCVLLFLSSILEFCITVSTAHFGCQAACCNTDTTIAFVPYPVASSVQPTEVMTLENSRGTPAAAEGRSFPPACEDTVPLSKGENN